MAPARHQSDGEIASALGLYKPMVRKMVRQELAEERARQTGNIETAQEEVWISWAEWKARELTGFFRNRA